jgi:3-deoxy-D-manno-octulosonic-acid transferase
MNRALYSLLLRLALPVQALRYLWRGARHPDNRGSLRAHLAMGLATRADQPLWLHAASVGEVQSLAPLVTQLRAAFPALPLLVTVGTVTGLARARQQWAQVAALTLLTAPWDLPGAARRFIDAVRPRAAVFVETELWPNLLQHASRTGIALLLVSARVSDRSAGRYRRWAAALMRDTARAFTRIGAQTAADRDRFISLGAEPRAVECWGNLKFDFAPPPGTVAQGGVLRSMLALDRAMWVAGSTHAGEEEACLVAHASLRDGARARGVSVPLLVIAPRRPERFEEVARLVAAQGFSLWRHSDGVRVTPAQADVLLVDRLGELLPYYAAADVAFVGGSLVSVGGHNLLEPAALGKPVLAGPHTGNASDVAARLESDGGLVRVHDAHSLAGVLGELLGDAALARRRGDAAAAVVAANGGATTRALEAISAELARWERPGGFPPVPSASC